MTDAKGRQHQYLYPMVTLNGGYYLGHRGNSSPWHPMSSKVSPIFLTRDEAIQWGRKHGYTVIEAHGTDAS